MIGVYNIALMKPWMFAGIALIAGAGLGGPRAAAYPLPVLRRAEPKRSLRPEQAPPLRPANATLTAIPGIKVGHHTLAERSTGCTVILIEGGATAGVDVRGAAPATKETDLLSPANLVEQIHAISLSGGSAFGLDSASGVMKYLEDKGIGFPFCGAPVRTVPAAALFDLPVGNAKIRPTPDCGYRAAVAASSAAVPEGSVGAGA